MILLNLFILARIILNKFVSLVTFSEKFSFNGFVKGFASFISITDRVTLWFTTSAYNALSVAILVETKMDQCDSINW